MRTLLVVFGGMTGREGLSATIDVVSANYALRGLMDAIGSGGARIAITDTGSASAMLEIMASGRSDIEITGLEDRDATLSLAASGTVDAILVVGGDENVLEMARDASLAAPDALFAPIGSTGGAAEALFDMEPGRFPETYARDLSYLRLMKGIVGASTSNEMRSPSR